MKYLNPTKLSTSNLLGAAMAAASLTVTAASFTYNATLAYQVPLFFSYFFFYFFD